jgi:hypothetical protein
MTKTFSLITFSFINFELCLRQEKLGSDWFKECLEDRTGIDRCIEYNLRVVMTFLS